MVNIINHNPIFDKEIVLNIDVYFKTGYIAYGLEE